MSNYELDKKRYGKDKMPAFQKYWRLANEMGIKAKLYEVLFKIERSKIGRAHV